MNPFIKKALGSVISIVATSAVTWLIAKGYLTADAGIQLTATLTSMGLIAAQRIWKKSEEQKVLLVMGSGGPMSEAAAQAVVKAGMAPPVTTGVHEIPQLTPVEAPKD